VSKSRLFFVLFLITLRSQLQREILVQVN